MSFFDKILVCLKSFCLSFPPDGCICCRRFHTEVFFSRTEELRVSWSSIFSSILTSFTNSSIAAWTLERRGLKVKGVWVQYQHKRAKAILTSLNKPWGDCPKTSFCLTQTSVTLHHSLSIMISHLLTPPPLAVTDQTKHEQKPGETGNVVIGH